MLYLINPFQGTLTRRGWWWLQLFILVLFIVMIGFTALSHLKEGPKAFASSFLWSYIFLAYLNFCTTINRLRDAGKSGFWYLATFLPVVGTGIIFYLCGIVGSNYAPGKSRLTMEEIDAIAAQMNPDRIDEAQVGNQMNTSSRPVHIYEKPELRGMVSARRGYGHTPDQKGFGRRGRAQ